MKPDPRDIRDARLREMETERIVSWSPSLQRWCVCNGFASLLATARTKEEAEAMKHTTQARQLPLL
jgi:hypothetical protein